jgi:putative ABC transport system permease protein
MGVPLSYNIRNLVERKGTSIMTALGIALTVAVLVVVLALVNGLASVFAASGDPSQLVILRKGTDAELSSSVSNDAYQRIRQLPGIAKNAEGDPYISPELVTVTNLVSVEAPLGMNVSIRGMLPIGLSMRKYTIEQGKNFEPGLKQCIVGDSIARRYPAARIGNTLHFGKSDWEVVGIFSAGESAANSEIWADLNQVRGDYEREGESSSLLVRTASADDMTALPEKIKADQNLLVNVLTEKAYYATMTASGLPLQILGYSVAVIMAVGSAFAATNTMYAAVARRSREIGTLRALGFSKGSILRSFLLESVFLAMTGGVVGILLALPINGLRTGIGNFQTFSDITFKFRVGAMAIAVGLIFAALIGAVGGLLPAWAAARKNIIQAMRDV